MNKQVKGLLKGLRYISQIFDGDQKEQEMQIGFPTDVKHVAHIGHDGPTVNNNPTWMNEFHSAPLSTSFANGGRELGSSPKSASQEMPLGGDPPPPDSPSSKPHRRSRRHGSSSESPGSGSAPAAGSESPARGSSRHSRRHQSAGSAPGSDSASNEGSRRSSRRSSKTSSTAAAAAGSESPAPGSESPNRDLPSIPKQSRRRKTKVGSDGGSSRSSARSKNPSFSDGDPDPEDGSTRHVPALETVVEGRD